MARICAAPCRRMEKQALKPIFLTGKEMVTFLEEDDTLNKGLMTEAGFVAP